MDVTRTQLCAKEPAPTDAFGDACLHPLPTITRSVDSLLFQNFTQPIMNFASRGFDSLMTRFVDPKDEIDLGERELHLEALFDAKHEVESGNSHGEEQWSTPFSMLTRENSIRRTCAQRIEPDERG